MTIVQVIKGMKREIELEMARPKGDQKAAAEAENAGTDNREADGSNNDSAVEKTCNDPINVVTGSQKMVQTDMVIKDTVETFYIYRTYQSVHENKGGLLGSRWYLNIGSWLYVKEDRATAILPDMHLERFTRKGEERENDHVTRQTLSNGQEYIILYDDALRVNTFLTPSNGSRREYHYNKDELLVRTVYTDGTAEVLGYDRYRNKNYVKDRMGGELRSQYDVYGNLLEEAQPNGLVTQFAYDGENNLVRQWDNADREQEMSYDSRGNWVQFAYKNNEGGMASVTTAEGITIRFTYDAAGRCMSVTDEMGTAEYAYNPRDHVARETDPLGNTTKYFYDMPGGNLCCDRYVCTRSRGTVKNSIYVILFTV